MLCLAITPITSTQLDTLVTDGGKAYYLVSLDEATGSTFKATDVSVVDFDGDG